MPVIVLRWFLPVLMLAVLSCQSETDLPPEILPPDTMVQVLSDIYLHEAILSNVTARFDSLEYYRREQLDDIFASHRISRARFDSSYHYYEQDIEQLLEIQDAVLIELTKRKDKMLRKKQDTLVPEDRGKE
jgi:hypothetical protein